MAGLLAFLRRISVARRRALRATAFALIAVLVWPGLGHAATDRSAPGARRAATERPRPSLNACVRTLLTRYQTAVVTVTMVVNERVVVMGREMGKHEEKTEVNGTVLDASGLTVLSNFTVNPSAEMASVMSDQGGARMKVDSDVSSVSIVLSDGTELPAQFVSRDNDQDLAFVRPREKPARPLDFVPFARATSAPEVLDNVVALHRLGRAVNRAIAVSVSRVEAVVSTPRTLYVAQNLTAFGCPVFSERGETLGISVMRLNPARGGAVSSMMAALQPVILPSEALLESARQAAAKQP